MTEFTPGPWGLSQYRPFDTEGPNAPLIWRAGPVDVRGENGEANSRLIATAPDLLAALESLLAARDYIAPVGISADAKLNNVALWDQARTAIAKARGTEE